MDPVSLIDDVRLFTTNRDCVGPLAVVLHSFSSSIETLDNEMERCPRIRPTMSPGCHTSYHYGIGAGCTFHQYVDIDNTAWGFGVLAPTCPEPICEPSECDSCTGLTAAQYNPNFDGVLPTLPAWSVGADGTVNCAVIHVAITGASNNDLDCCRFLTDPQSYSCFVKALCSIFEEADITPSQDTLLVHCGELPCLDIDQLVIDLLLCADAPIPVPPPCNCTPIARGVANVPDEGTIAVNSSTAMVYTSTTGGSITIDTPASSYSNTEFNIKNLSAVPLVVNSIDLIDGQLLITLAGTIASGYPFGADGGEAVHLVWNFDTESWMII